MAKTTRIAGLVAVLCFSAKPVLAADESAITCAFFDKVELRQSERAARSFFKAGKEAYAKGKYWESAMAFIACYRSTREIKIRTELLYNIGVAADHAEELEMALEAYRCYLAVGPTIKEEKVQIGARIRALENALVGKGRLRVIPEVPTSMPTVSSTPVIAPTLPVSRPERPVVTPILQPPVQTNVDREMSSTRKWMWTTAASGAAFLATGLGLGVSAKARLNEFEESCGRTPAGCSRTDIDSVEKRALLSNIFYSVGGATAITSVILYFVSRGETRSVPRRTVQVAPAGAGATLRVEW